MKKIREQGNFKAVIEASYGWDYMYDELSHWVEEVKVAHPLKTRVIAEAKIKTNPIDSEVLAHLLRTDLVAEVYAPGFETRVPQDFKVYKGCELLNNKLTPK